MRRGWDRPVDDTTRARDACVGRQPLISHPGTAGPHPHASVPGQHRPWHPHSLLVLHRDGRWIPPKATELLRHDPAVAAAAPVRDAGRPGSPLRNDTRDTSVAVPAPDRWTGTRERHP
jgi:hypothetical protein